MDANELFRLYSEARKDFRFKDLKWLSLTTASLRGVNFVGENLSGTNFVNSGLTNPILNWASFKQENLVNTNLVRLKMPVDIIHNERINLVFFKPMSKVLMLEKYDLLGVANLIFATPQSGILIMESSTPKTSSTNVSNLPLKESQNAKIWGFTPGAETLNGRLAMLGFVSALLLEFFSGQGVLHFFNLL